MSEWNVSKRDDVYHLFDIKRKDGKIDNYCPNKNIVIWRELTYEDKQNLMRKDLELKEDSKTLQEALQTYSEALIIGMIFDSGIITDEQYAHLEKIGTWKIVS